MFTDISTRNLTDKSRIVPKRVACPRIAAKLKVRFSDYIIITSFRISRKATL